MPPRGIIRDLLDINQPEFEKMTSGRSWGRRPTLKSKSRTQLNIEYKRREIELFEGLRNLTLNDIPEDNDESEVELEASKPQVTLTSTLNMSDQGQGQVEL